MMLIEEVRHEEIDIVLRYTPCLFIARCILAYIYSFMNGSISRRICLRGFDCTALVFMGCNTCEEILSGV